MYSLTYLAQNIHSLFKTATGWDPWELDIPVNVLSDSTFGVSLFFRFATEYSIAPISLTNVFAKPLHLKMSKMFAAVYVLRRYGEIRMRTKIVKDVMLDKYYGNRITER